MANNGVPYSLAARAAYDFAVSRGWARAMLPAEVPLRLPALLAGLGSLVVIALLARRWGGAWAGMIAATVAAVHPWHVRYSTEARSHSLVLLLALALFYAVASRPEAVLGLSYRTSDEEGKCVRWPARPLGRRPDEHPGLTALGL